MIDLELAKKIGATHYHDDCRFLYKVANDAVYFYGTSGNWLDSVNGFKFHHGLKEINFNQKPPRTKVEYVKCEFEKFSDAVLAFEGGPLYCIGGKDVRHYKVSRISTLTRQFEKDNLYRRTEVEIDWRDEVFDFLDGDEKGAIYMQERFEGKELNWFTEEDFLEMCRVALRATGELTDKPQ